MKTFMCIMIPAHKYNLFLSLINHHCINKCCFGKQKKIMSGGEFPMITNICIIFKNRKRKQRLLTFIVHNQKKNMTTLKA